MKKVLVFATMAILSLSASAQAKFAVVDFNEIITLAPEADAARNQIQEASKIAQENLMSMQEEGQAKLTEYQQKSANWTQAIRESKEKELNDISNRIQEFQQSVQLELQQKQQELMEPIYKKAQETVEKIAKASGCALVFDKNQCLFFDPAQVKDITAEARTAMGIPEGRTIESLQKELQNAAQ